MTDTTKEKETTEDPAPPSVEIVAADLVQVEVERHERGIVDKLQKSSPEQWQLELTNRFEILGRFRKASIVTTVPIDWTLFKGPEGEVVGVPRKSACAHMRKLMGISITNYRPKSPQGDAQPSIEYEEVEGTKTKPAHRVTVVTMIANGYCHITGEFLEDVRHAVRSDESFTGRGTTQDLTQSCRSGLDSKITRILADVVKVPEGVLKKLGIDTERCYKGAGFGTSKDRTAKGVAEEGIPEKANELGRDILSRTGGDKEAARSVMVDITKNDEKGFKGFDSVERLTKQWQLDAAKERLKAHPMFGDDREPGSDE